MNYEITIIKIKEPDEKEQNFARHMGELTSVGHYRNTIFHAREINPDDAIELLQHLYEIQHRNNRLKKD